MRTFTQQSEGSKQAIPTKSAVPSQAHFESSQGVNSVLNLQRTIGNQATQRLLQAKVEQHEANSISNEAPELIHDISQLSMIRASRGQVQPTMALSTPEDMHEQETSHVADQVMNIPESQLQRDSACGNTGPHCKMHQTGQHSSGKKMESVLDSNKTIRTVSSRIMRQKKTSGMPSTARVTILRPWNLLPGPLRTVYQQSYTAGKLIRWIYDQRGRNAEENFNKFALNQNNYGHYVSLLQMYSALNKVGLWGSVHYLVVPNFGAERAQFSIKFIPKNRQDLIGKLKGNKGFCRDTKIGATYHKGASFRQMAPAGTDGLHIVIGASTVSAHIDWISPAKGRDIDGYCEYSGWHGLRHWAWEAKGVPYIPHDYMQDTFIPF